MYRVQPTEGIEGREQIRWPSVKEGNPGDQPCRQ